MCRIHPITLAIVLLAAAASARASDPYKAVPGPFAVNTFQADWTDASQTPPTVPVRVYYPQKIAAATAPFPLIVFSHGLGGSREGYGMWAQQWVSCGYIVVLPSHYGSDGAAILDALRAPDAATAAAGKVMSVQTALRRTRDVSFIITHMTEANAGKLTDKTLAPFKGKVDLQHVGMAGHSFGALTTLMIAGEGEAQLGALAVNDPRVTAAIAMSPQPSKSPDQKKAFGSIKIPVLHLTGTLDDAPVGVSDVKAAQRRIPYDSSSFSDTSLVIFNGATHMTFSARALAPTAAEKNIDSLIKQSTTAFWDAHLKSDPKAAAWLEKDFAKVMGTAGTLERKTPASAPAPKAP